jgi:hypothetical protein
MEKQMVTIGETKKMKKLITICMAAVLIGAVLTLTANTAVADTIYSNDFESAVGSEWSNTSTAVTPAGARKFLGQFGNQTVSLTLGSLPAHDSVTLSFDLFVINSWDGVGPNGPDVWTLGVEGGPMLLNTTFSNVEELGRKQSYPDSYPGAEYPAGTGAAEIDTLGYTYYGNSVYHLEYSFAHSDDSIVFNFSASGLQGINDESWGIDNVTVDVVPEPATICMLGLGVLGLLRRKF